MPDYKQHRKQALFLQRAFNPWKLVHNQIKDG
jgi:hypothetical protein